MHRPCLNPLEAAELRYGKTRKSRLNTQPEYEVSLFTHQGDGLHQAYDLAGRAIWSGWQESPEKAKAALTVKLQSLGIITPINERLLCNSPCS